MRTLRTATLVGALVAGAVLTPAAAQATPSSGVSATVIFTATYGGTVYTLREVTIQPGGSTGWHYHDGTLYGEVKSGKLTHLASDCTSVETYRAGETLIEPPGAANVHLGRNLGRRPVVLNVLYVLPVGSPFSEDAADPGCDQ
jgi:quercetin dioxygenase-like cupin family protein